MAGPLDADLALRLDVLERRCAKHRNVALIALSAGIVLGVMLTSALPPMLAQGRRVDEVLTVRGLVVVDERGVERVRLEAPLPDPIVQGNRVPRKGIVSGILIFDADGNERGGYVTSQNGDAFLTLDSAKEQQAIFIANRDGGANLSVWSGTNRGNYVSIRAVPTPMIEIVQNGKSVYRAGGTDAFSK